MSSNSVDHPAGPVTMAAGRAVAGRRPLRVLLVQTQAEGAGAQEITRLLAARLERRGLEPHTLFFYRRTAAYDGQPRTVFCETVRPTGVFGMLRFFARLVAAIRRIDPDVVLTYQHFGNVVGAAATRLAGWAPVIANQVSAQMVTPGPIRAIDALFGRLGLYAGITVNSAATLADYAGHAAAYRRRIVSIPHGFENKTRAMPKAEARAALGLPPGATLIGSTGRLHPTKHFDAAIRLLPGRPDWRFAVAGQGADRDRLEALAAELGVRDRLILLGELTPAEVGVFLAALDAFVFPSQGETFGLAVVEAAQTGVPVVANDIAVLREVLASDGEPAALFVDVDDTAAFAAAVDRALGDEAVSGAITAAGRRLERRYSVDAMVDAYVDLIDRVLAGGSRP
ncbi:glycosyltransferase family 4 protein [Chthonobacter rhizosphaerae]|uniref:glycosyltransferase family 4 protein n=1 Tax=Chthonobacter rhizosphaerae TaxID=2735553 RepID=UPI001FE309F3|nr:glycosyltransferase family 4 protein [Chthonobacter rhizosphaerae]